MSEWQSNVLWWEFSPSNTKWAKRHVCLKVLEYEDQHRGWQQR